MAVVFPAPPHVVLGQNELPQRVGSSPLLGLGYVKLGGNPSGMRGLSRFNVSSSRGEKGAGPWAVRAGGIFTSPSDANLAQWVYRFQHDYQNCPGEGGQNVRSRSQGEGWDPYKRRTDCENRDGMIGAATMCQIAKAVTTGVPFWGKFWGDNLDLKRNQSFYASGAGSEQGCSFLCSDVSCGKRAATGCPPCGSPAAKTTSTGATNEVNQGQRHTYRPPPGKKIGGRAVPEPIVSVKITEGPDLMMVGGIVALAGLTLYWGYKNRGWFQS
jgi:hypothetical protein